MIKTLLIRELQNFIYGLRFQVSFVIVILVFTIGSFAFISSYTETQTNNLQHKQSEQTTLEERVFNVSKVATSQQRFFMTPIDNGIISDCKDGFLPNQIFYNAYNVFNFSIRYYAQNPLMDRVESLSWSFIVSMFISFIVLLFAFDAVSGDKEDRTLTLVLSNSVPRSLFLLSKFVSIITVVGVMVITGIILSVLIMTISGKVNIDGNFLVETVSFIGVTLLLITVFALFGLFSSVITRHSNVSLLISLCFWLLVAVVIPNTSVFWAKKLFSIPSASQIEAIIDAEHDDIKRNSPEGSWAYYGSIPFHPSHQPRATNMINLMNAEKRHKDVYYQQMFQQFEKTRNITALSPITQFDYINEALLGGGYMRFRKNWDDLHVFQPMFLQWFKDVDAKDDKSPHWYNPYEEASTSKTPVEIDQIPIYQEQTVPFSQRILFILPYLIAMIVTVGVLFVACFYSFGRYDVR